MLFEDKSLEIIQKTIRDERAEMEYQKESINDVLLDFYGNNQLQEEYLADYGFKDDKGKTDLPMMAVNLTKKIIDKRRSLIRFHWRIRSRLTDIYQTRITTK